MGRLHIANLGDGVGNRTEELLARVNFDWPSKVLLPYSLLSLVWLLTLLPSLLARHPLTQRPRTRFVTTSESAVRDDTTVAGLQGWPDWGTCWETLVGGNHFRAWKQDGPFGRTGAWFLAYVHPSLPSIVANGPLVILPAP